MDSFDDTPESDVDIGRIAERLHDSAVAATPGWIRSSVVRVAASQGIVISESDEELIQDAQARGEVFVDERLGRLLRTDFSEQKSTPLSVFRDAARFPVEVLHQLGATEVTRIDVERWAFPNDPFGVTPASLADLGPEVQEAGIAWGAAKAHVHLTRHRPPAGPTKR
ncbi:MAG: hypothetical protein ACR2PK_15680 [Acidimicrobiales bacterium]